ATAPCQRHTLSLHDALPICPHLSMRRRGSGRDRVACRPTGIPAATQTQLDDRYRISSRHDEMTHLDPLAVAERRDIPHLAPRGRDRKSTRLNSSHVKISYAV